MIIHEGQYELRLQNGMGDQVSDRIAVRLAVRGMNATQAVEAASSPRDGRWLLAKTSRSSAQGIAEAARVLGVEPAALFGVTGGHPGSEGLRKLLDSMILTVTLEQFKARAEGADDG